MFNKFPHLFSSQIQFCSLVIFFTLISDIFRRWCYKNGRCTYCYLISSFPFPRGIRPMSCCILVIWFASPLVKKYNYRLCLTMLTDLLNEEFWLIDFPYIRTFSKPFSLNQMTRWMKGQGYSPDLPLWHLYPLYNGLGVSAIEKTIWWTTTNVEICRKS